MNKVPDLVSVIIPTYNRPHFLKRAIESVLNQSYKKIEIIVVDNCSENRVEHLVSDFHDSRLVYHFNNKKGPSAARNLGIKVASGEYISFLDDDDEYTPQKLELQRKRLYPFTKYYWTYGAGQIIRKKEEIIYKPKYKYCSTFLIGVYCQILMPSLLLRSECFNEELLFDTEMFYAEDWDLWYRISRNYNVLATNDIVYRVHYEHEENRLTANDKFIEGINNFRKRYINNMNLVQKILFTFKSNLDIRNVKKKSLN